MHPPDPPDLPDPPPELEKLRYQATLDDWKAERQAKREAERETRKLIETRRDARVSAEDSLRAAGQEAYLEAAKASLERSLKRANFVTAGAGAIATTYAGLLALVFSATGTDSTPLPATGIGPALFLGLSLVLSVVYAAFLTETRRRGRYLPTGLSPHLQEDRMLTFVAWIGRGIFPRAWALRLSILSLGIGVALLPSPFLGLDESSRWILTGLGAVVLVIAAIYELGWFVWKHFFRASSNDESMLTPPGGADLPTG